MTVDVRLRPEAEQDLADAAMWYEEQRPGLGQEFLDEALATFSAIAEGPLASSAVYGSLRRALLHRFPFCVFYVADRDGAVVVGVFHGSRQLADTRLRGRIVNVAGREPSTDVASATALPAMRF